jgi:hypothetical protein
MADKESLAARLTAQDKKAMLAVITELYAAYQARSSQRVMEIIEGAVEASAQEWQKSGRGSAQQIREAFLAFHEDIFHHPQYRLKPLNTKHVVWEDGPGGTVVLASAVPMIATEPMTFTDNGTPVQVKLRLGRFTFSKAPRTRTRQATSPEGEPTTTTEVLQGGWRLVRLDLF